MPKSKSLMVLSFNSEVLPPELESLANCKTIVCPNPNKIDDISEALRKERPCLVLIEESVGDEKKVVETVEAITEAVDDYGFKTTICFFAKERIIHPKISWVKNIEEAKGLWDRL